MTYKNPSGVIETRGSYVIPADPDQGLGAKHYRSVIRTYPGMKDFTVDVEVYAHQPGYPESLLAEGSPQDIEDALRWEQRISRRMLRHAVLALTTGGTAVSKAKARKTTPGGRRTNPEVPHNRWYRRTGLWYYSTPDAFYVAEPRGSQFLAYGHRRSDGAEVFRTTGSLECVKARVEADSSGSAIERKNPSKWVSPNRTHALRRAGQGKVPCTFGYVTTQVGSPRFGAFRVQWVDDASGEPLDHETVFVTDVEYVRGPQAKANPRPSRPTIEGHPGWEGEVEYGPGRFISYKRRVTPRKGAVVQTGRISGDTKLYYDAGLYGVKGGQGEQRWRGLGRFDTREAAFKAADAAVDSGALQNSTPKSRNRR